MKVLPFAHTLLLAAAGVFLFGCARNPPAPAQADRASSPPAAAGPALELREAVSPAGSDSREPELTASAGGRVIMSWIERVGEKRYALRFASRDAAGWSEPRTVAEGENWFVNWADFPSVIELSDGSLAAHWLVKSGPGTYA